MNGEAEPGPSTPTVGAGHIDQGLRVVRCKYVEADDPDGITAAETISVALDGLTHEIGVTSMSWHVEGS